MKDEIPEIYYEYVKDLTPLQRKILLEAKTQGPFHKDSYASAGTWGKIKHIYR